MRRARNSGGHRRAGDFFAFDLASVETYFVADRVLKGAPDGLRWMPAVLGASNGSRPDLDDGADAAARRAAQLGLPLQWPANHAAEVPRAMRAADYAAAHGFGGEFMHICSRLRYAGGFDIDSEMPASERVGTLSRSLARGLAEAADDETRDPLLAAAASWLAAQGVGCLPALRLADRLACGHAPVIELVERGRERERLTLVLEVRASRCKGLTRS